MNDEEFRARRRAWYAASPEQQEKARARARAWNLAHRDAERDRKAQPDQLAKARARAAAWRAAHPDRFAAYQHSHRSEKLAYNAGRVRLGAGYRTHIGRLPDELRPLARLLQEARREFGGRG